MAYESPPPPHPLGMFREKVERLKRKRGLDEAGFPLKSAEEEPDEDDQVPCQKC